jgi:prevent-host-death family protein
MYNLADMNVIEIGAFEAKNKLAGLLDRVAHGQRVIITRRGRPVALLTDPADLAPRAEDLSPAETLKKMDAIRRRGRPPGCSLKDLVNEGRRI